ncbi:endocuticle structural glycoprotein SgAbd-5-like [Onthophagus taurus]|uniref:endocuticle structural glycoprotein SgAbd-5-like n=1 Tax=Onthophagus taurus TaxID=166361 RepID=UPI000C206E9C|nr:endocuticle structural glycoprotein SgAbd-5-like [Onthophagus taurus]
MKLLVVFAVLFYFASSASVENPKGQVVEGIGGYNFGFATSNGIYVEEKGLLQNVGNWDEGIAVQGKYEYTAPNGAVYIVDYVADNNGFRPKIQYKKGP